MTGQGLTVTRTGCPLQMTLKSLLCSLETNQCCTTFTDCRISQTEALTCPPPVGMVSIPDESYMHRVPEGAIQVSETPVSEDESGLFLRRGGFSDDGEVSRRLGGSQGD